MIDFTDRDGENKKGGKSTFKEGFENFHRATAA